MTRSIISTLRSCSLLCFTSASLWVGAQELKLPSWMLAALAHESTPAQEARADSMLYAALGVDSVSANGFIGTWSGRLDIAADGKEMVMDITSWTDTTKAILHIAVKDKMSMWYVADLRANAIILASDEPGKRQATVMSLQDVVLMNNMMAGALAEQGAPKDTKRKRTILGHPCTEHMHIEGRDTIHYWVSGVKPSPFRDAVNWAPLHGPTMLFGLLGAAGTRMPLRMTSEKMNLEVTAIQQGPQPPPTFDLSTYTVDDKRKQPLRTLSIRKGPSPFWEARPKNTASAGTGPGTPTKSKTSAGERTPPPVVEEVTISEMSISEEGEAGPVVEVPPPPVEEVVFDAGVIEEQPLFPGGQEALFRYINTTMRYPEVEKEAGIQGKVFVEFEISADGSIEDVVVKRGVMGGGGLDHEAVRIVKSMPKWVPGKINGRPVKVRYILPIAFKLQ